VQIQKRHSLFLCMFVGVCFFSYIYIYILVKYVINVLICFQITFITSSFIVQRCCVSRVWLGTQERLVKVGTRGLCVGGVVGV